jgi:hypothetical protein
MAEKEVTADELHGQKEKEKKQGGADDRRFQSGRDSGP